MANALKIGIYICSGFGIDEVIDCEKLSEDVSKIDNVILTTIKKNLCTQVGAEQIRKDILEHHLTAVIIGASSPRYHTDIFRFDDILLDRVNLREQVAWTKEAKNEHTQALAMDYMRMGIARIKAMTMPSPMTLEINETVLVVGGGVTGMNSAISAADAGYPVVISEKEAALGGYYKKLHKVTPSNGLHLSPEPNLCKELVARVLSHPNIEVLTNCTIDKTHGQPGMFDIDASSNGDIFKFQVGSIIQATGWKPYNPNKLDHLGYGRCKNVITNLEMEGLASAGTIVRPSDQKEITSVVFIQCAGSRDENHLPYCSSFCCMNALKQALYIKDQYPNAAIYVVYKDMRTPGQYEMFYKRVQNEDNIFLTKGEIAGLTELEDGTITVDIDDTLIGKEISIDADLVVLAVGMQPVTTPKENNCAAEGTEKTDEKKEEQSNEDITQEPETSILNLTYRQGKDLPLLHYGFPDSHYICFPYETRRTGIYAAGTARAPMDAIQAKNDALGASLKAIQIIENTKNGTAVHPRSGDKTYPDFFLQRCTQCKRCTEECPFGTLDEDTKGTPKPNPNRCRRCGICMGACPERIISFEDYSIIQISSMIKSIYVPTEEDDGEATPRIIAFMCENDAYPSMDMVAKQRIHYSPYVRIIPVRCLGSVSTSWIADSLSQGFDGVLLIGCKYGEDYQCHFIRGSELANKRMENVQEKLKQLVLEPERVEIHTLSIDEYHKIPDIINTFAETIETVGANPYKEM